MSGGLLHHPRKGGRSVYVVDASAWLVRMVR